MCKENRNAVGFVCCLEDRVLGLHVDVRWGIYFLTYFFNLKFIFKFLAIFKSFYAMSEISLKF